jgi:site-specific recombinase XerD
VHDLRHTYSSHAIRLGISANVLKDALGHENISTTLDIYSHIFKSQQEELATTMNGILSKT